MWNSLLVLFLITSLSVSSMYLQKAPGAPVRPKGTDTVCRLSSEGGKHLSWLQSLNILVLALDTCSFSNKPRTISL
jgi:hypothetical protein